MAISVSMPEAAVDEYHGSVLWKYYVRRTRQLRVILAEAEAHTVQSGTESNLRLRNTADTGHIVMALGFGQVVHWCEMLW